MGAIVPFETRGGIEIEKFLREAPELGAELVSLGSTLLGLVTAAMASGEGVDVISESWMSGRFGAHTLCLHPLGT